MCEDIIDWNTRMVSVMCQKTNVFKKYEHPFPVLGALYKNVDVNFLKHLHFPLYTVQWIVAELIASNALNLKDLTLYIWHLKRWWRGNVPFGSSLINRFIH